MIGDNSTMSFAPWPARDRFAPSCALSGGYLTSVAESTAGNHLNSRRMEEPPEPRLIQSSGSCWSMCSWVKSGHGHFTFWGCQHILRCHIPLALHLAYTCALLLALSSADVWIQEKPFLQIIQRGWKIDFCPDFPVGAPLNPFQAKWPGLIFKM